MTQTPLEIYQSRLKSGDIKPDSVQEQAVAELQRLFDEVIARENAPKASLFKRLTKGKKGDVSLKGVYFHGGVGRGKSMLMDLFYDALPETVKKRRVHFHEFMIEVHDYIHSRSMDGSVMGIVDQALPSLAALIASNSRVLCFDEFHVVDITDAMILGRLFKILFEHDVTVVTTSNWAPDDLYKNGLQRDRFLPFIALLKTKVNTFHLDSPHDYRTQKTQIEGTYFVPLGRATTKIMDEIFKSLIDGEKPKKDVLRVKGRDIEVKKAAAGVARFTFSQLCERPHGAEDYLEIARKYHTVFLEGIPKLGYDRRNEAKRLMNLIDALYEAHTSVIISAAVEAEQLYAGHDHAYEFERTVSRLLEMQSDEWG
ncbi:MAG: cell division protein ZapE [Alphaproteobacteria bacterium]|nr:MAG: cell division protein ZapE [Alphaproteobacteria bacterium]